MTAGAPLTPDGDHRQRPPRAPSQPRWRRRARLRKLIGGLLGVATLGVLAAGVGGWVGSRYITADLPSIEGLRGYQPPVMSRIYAENGRLIAELATQRRIFVPGSAIPDLLKAAFISAEDQNFWRNPGIDPLAILRAGLFDLTHLGTGRRPIGASTITQQVAKNMLLGDRMDLTRKIEEAVLAIRMQQVLSKERILEIYLNEIYLGQQSYGIAAAAQAYFNKPLDELSLAEDATLAALPKAPSNYNPFRFPSAATARRNWVLDRMADDHVVTTAQATVAKSEPLVAVEFHKPAPIPGADWFAEDARRELIARFGTDVVMQGGLTARTSLDPVLQTAADEALRRGLMDYDRKMGGWRGPVSHIDVGPINSGAFSHGWAAPLAEVARPSGMLPDWQLAVVLGVSSADAHVGWLGPSPRADAAPALRTGIVRLSDEAWHRPMTADGKPAATYRSFADMIRPGDVVMI